MLKCCIIKSWIMAFSTTTTTSNSKTNTTNPGCSLISSHPIMSCISTIEHTDKTNTHEMCKTEQGGSSLENNYTVTISLKGFKEHKPVTDSYQKKHAEEQKKTDSEREENTQSHVNMVRLRLCSLFLSWRVCLNISPVLYSENKATVEQTFTTQCECLRSLKWSICHYPTRCSHNVERHALQNVSVCFNGVRPSKLTTGN